MFAPTLPTRTFQSTRLVHVCSALLLCASALLTACGSGSIAEQLVPKRLASFGDGLSDVGQNSGQRYTVNDGSVNVWVQQIATSYGLTLTPSGSGGLGFAQADALIEGSNSIAAQISSFLATQTLGADDLIVVDPGYAQLATLAQNNADDAALIRAADLAGKAYAVQVKRLTAAGGLHVVVANAPDLGKTPFATAQKRATAFTNASRAFNDGLKIALADVSNSVLLIDNESEVNRIFNNSSGLLGSGGNVSAPACATPTALTCTPSTLAAGVTNFNLHLYADDRHLSPAAARLIGTNAYNKIKGRW